jgi:AGCS family alanine or glycine:cation symporter
MLERIETIFGFIWGGPLLVMVVFIGVFFTIQLKGFQVTHFGKIMRDTVGTLFGKNKKDTTGQGQLKSFQVAATVLSGTMGAGSISGVAAAIAIGGPGAVFWMWIIAALGMMTKMVEVTLSVFYRKKSDTGEFYGGPMHYILRGLGKNWKPLATLYSIALLILVLADSCIQANQMADVLNNEFDIPEYGVGAFIVLIGAVVIGKGVKGLGQFCTKILPPIALLYLIGTGWVIIYNGSAIPEVFGLIFRYAFAPAPAMGGFLGAGIMLAVSKGAARGVWTSEAGIGTSGAAHSTASVDHPFRQGMWGAVEVFIVSVITVNFTAFAVLTSGLWNSDGANQEGINLTFGSLHTAWPAMAVNIFTFGVSLILFTSFMGASIRYRNAIEALFGEKVLAWLKWGYLILPFITIKTAVPLIWVCGDIALGFLALPNLIAIFLLRSVFINLYKDYMVRDKNGTLNKPIDFKKIGGKFAPKDVAL